MTSLSHEPFLAGWRYRALIYSVVLSALGYLGFALFGGWREVTSALVQVGGTGLLLALLLSLANYGLRYLRWHLYLSTLGHRIPWRPGFQIYLAGFALTTTPGKAGEAFRGLLLKRRGVPYPDSFAAFFSERLSDLIAIVLLTLLGLSLYPQAWPLILLGGLLCLGLLAMLGWREGLLGLQRRLPHLGRWQRWVGHGFEILLQAQRCHRPALLLLATLLSLLGWTAEAFAFHLILDWMGVEASFMFAAFVFALAMLAGALSFTPGGLGSTEGVMAALLIWHGVAAPEAIAATVLIRSTTLWFAVGLGVAALATTATEPPREARSEGNEDG